MPVCKSNSVRGTCSARTSASLSVYCNCGFSNRSSRWDLSICVKTGIFDADPRVFIFYTQPHVLRVVRWPHSPPPRAARGSALMHRVPEARLRQEVLFCNFARVTPATAWSVRSTSCGNCPGLDASRGHPARGPLCARANARLRSCTVVHVTSENQADQAAASLRRCLKLFECAHLSRSLSDADTPALIDLSACLVKPCVADGAFSSAPSRARTGHIRHIGRRPPC